MRGLLRYSLGLAVLLSATPAGAQSTSYPNRPVQIILDVPVGSAPDVGLRFVAEGLSQIWGQQTIAVNRPGAGDSLAVRAAASAAPDGYTLFQPALSTFAPLNPVAPYVPVHLPKDFLPVGFVSEIPIFFAVPPSAGISSMADLIDRAKKNPGKLSYATTGVGRLPHLTGELFNKQAGVSTVAVPYSGGSAQAFGDIATGRVDMIIEGYSALAGAVQAGAIKLIAVATDKRLPDFPDVPTVAETIPGFRATGWAVMVAPLGTPEPIVNKISSDLHKAASQPELQRKLANLGSYANPMSPAELTAFVDQQQQVWQPIAAEVAKTQKQ
jgi:tripartite-type tricarboxylate transporter receptor subunit TctC